MHPTSPINSTQRNNYNNDKKKKGKYADSDVHCAFKPTAIKNLVAFSLYLLSSNRGKRIADICGKAREASFLF